MAKIKLSSVGITNISGKAGGSVYSRNRGGSYFKNFVMPSNTITDARQIVRAIFGVIAGYWRQLTQSQRQSFTDQAPFYPVIDVFGDSKILSGNALHQKLNTQLLNANLPAISLALSPQGTNPIFSTTANAATITLIDLEFDLSADNATLGIEYVLEATPPHSASVKNVANLYRRFSATTSALGTTPPADQLKSDMFSTSATTLYNEYALQFGALTVGDVVDFRVKGINPATGEESAYWYVTTVVD